MYAVSHASAALLIRRRAPWVPLLALLIAVQAVELLWIIFSFIGLEHIAVYGGLLHLNFLPYSHSIATGLLLAALAWLVLAVGLKRRDLGLAIAIAVLSHVILDAIFHEPDIQLAPGIRHPLLGLGIVLHPWLNFALEISFCTLCWWVFRGRRSLLVAILLFNVLDLPMMLGHGDAVLPFAQHRYLLPSIILVQIMVTTLAFLLFARADARTVEPPRPTEASSSAAV